MVAPTLGPKPGINVLVICGKVPSVAVKIGNVGLIAVPIKVGKVVKVGKVGKVKVSVGKVSVGIGLFSSASRRARMELIRSAVIRSPGFTLSCAIVHSPSAPPRYGATAIDV